MPSRKKNSNWRKLENQRKEILKAFDRKIPREVAVEALEFFQERFDEQGWKDKTLDPWKKRKSKEDDAGRNLLVKSGKLRDSIEIVQQDENAVIIESDGVPYANIHNEGGRITVPVTKRMRDYFWYKFHKTGLLKYKYMALTKKEKFKITIPQRKFMGQSDTLDNRVSKIVINVLNRILDGSRQRRI